MSITANKLVHNVLNIATSGTNSDDFRIPERLILEWINEVRSMLISQAIQKRQDISEVWIQILECVELIQVDKSECPCNTSDCVVLRSKYKIPRTVETDGDNTIIAVTGIEGKTISKYNKHKAKYAKFRKYTSRNTGWYLKNDYLYIINDELIKNISIFLIAEDPSELANYTNCSNEACWTVDSAYPASLKMANDIVNIVVKTKVIPLLGLPTDRLNDSDNDSFTPNKQ